MEQEPDLRSDASMHDAALSAFSDLLEVEGRMREIERALADADADRRKDLLRQLGALQSRFEHAGGYQQESRVSTVLMGLGFGRADSARPVSVLSGGSARALRSPAFSSARPTCSSSTSRPTTLTSPASNGWKPISRRSSAARR